MSAWNMLTVFFLNSNPGKKKCTVFAFSNGINDITFFQIPVAADPKASGKTL